MLVAIATAMPWLPLTSRFGKPGRQDGRYLVLAGIVVLEVDRVLVDAVEQVGGDVGQPAFGVAGRGRAVVEGSEVAVPVDQRMAQAERLGHAHQGVVQGGVSVGVVAPHDVAGDPGALEMRDGPGGHPCRACRRAAAGAPA